MPQIFRIGNYLVYFWANEGDPLEPVHVHVAEGVPSVNATKIWITKNGKCLLCNNNSRIPGKMLRDIMDVIEARYMDVFNKWHSFYGEIKYYC
ncbi:DUF4160 domain-containing protein [Blautia schinkii]|nr:DUF4160 domain-containing protein [Blautia schinkii]